MKNNRINVISNQKKQIIRITCLFSFLLTTYSLWAQPSFTTKLSTNKIGLQQRLEISFEMANANNVEAFTAPKFQGFTVVGGPVQSSYNSSVNGVSSSRITITYYLQPLKTGKLVIDGAHAMIDGKTITSNRTTVQVQNETVDQPTDNTASNPSLSPFDDPFFSGRQQPPAAPQTSAQDRAFAEAHVLRPGESMQKKIDNNLFIKVFTNKTTVYEGEPIVATYKLYSRLDMTAGVTKRPSFSGFSAFDMEEPSQSGVQETLNGQNYICYTIRKVQLYPLQSGQLTLEPLEVDCDIKFLKLDNASQPGFNITDTANIKQLQYQLKNQPIKITALPFPEKDKPADFKGAVGNFKISIATTNTEIGKDDAEKLQITITGSGNFSMVQSPEIAWPKTIEAYDPKQKEALDQTVSPMSGTKVFEYVFICHQPGHDTIPPIRLSYFDVASKTYKTISSGQIVLSILPQSKHPQKAMTDEATGLPELLIDIAKFLLPILVIGLCVYIYFDTKEKKKKKYLIYVQELKEKKAREDAWEKLMAESKTSNQKKQWETTSSQHESYMPTSFEAPVITEAVEEKEETKPNKTTEIKVPASDLILADSQKVLWQGEDKIFFQTLKNEILKLLKTKANTATNDKNELFENLKKQGKDETVLQQLKNMVDECDALAYSPLQTPPDRNSTMEEVRFLLERL